VEPRKRGDSGTSVVPRNEGSKETGGSQDPKHGPLSMTCYVTCSVISAQWCSVVLSIVITTEHYVSPKYIASRNTTLTVRVQPSQLSLSLDFNQPSS
jgi:hypothetical protein